MSKGGPPCFRDRSTRRDHLKDDVAARSHLAVGREYGTSDNAIRKWIRTYEAEQASPGTGA